MNNKINNNKEVNSKTGSLLPGGSFGAPPIPAGSAMLTSLSGNRGAAPAWALASLAILAVVAGVVILMERPEGDLNRKVVSLQAQVYQLQQKADGAGLSDADAHRLAELEKDLKDLKDKTGHLPDETKTELRNLAKSVDAIQIAAGSRSRGSQGATGSTGAAGSQGTAGPPGPSGVASCPNGDCLSLQPASPGIQETGGINISGGAIIGGALSAGSLSGNGLAVSSLNASQLASGTVANSRLTSAVTLQGNSFNGASQLVQLTAGGLLPALDGSNLTSLNAANVTQGTLQDGRLSANVALLDRTNQSFTGANTFTQGLTLQGGLNVSSSNPVVATFNGRVAAAGAVNPGELATLSQVTAASSGAFIQNGNSFGTTAVLGTNDAFDLQLETGGTTKLTIQNSTGNVGIGTTNPGAKLQVTAGTATTIGQIVRGAASQTADLLQFQDSTGTVLTSFDSAGALRRSASGSYLFSSGTSPQNLFVASSASNVPLAVKGFASQTADLQQWQNSAGTVLARVDASGNGFFNNGAGGTGAAFVQGGNSFGATANLGTNDAFDLALRTGGTTRLTVQNSTGNVGIGTTTPGSKLELGSGQIAVPLGTAAAPSYTFSADTDTGIYAFGGGTFGFAVNGGFAGWIGSSGLRVVQQVTSDSGTLAAPNFSTIVDTNTGLLFPIGSADNLALVTGGVDRLHINASGNVGIGTASPGYKLDVAGDINSSTALRVGGASVCTASGCTASGSYVNLQAASPGTPQTGNLNLSGTGIFGTAVQTPLVDTAAAGVLGIGTTNATAINLNQNTAVAAGKTLTVGGAATFSSTMSVTGAVTLSSTLSVTGDAAFSGNIAFSANTRGKDEAITAAATTLVIAGKTYPDSSYAVNCTPNYNTTCFVSAKTTTGFTLNFGTAAPADASGRADWLVVR